MFFIEFVPQDVGTYVMDVYASGQKLPDSPVFYKVYDASLIRITEAGSGVVGQPCQFKVDASQAVSTIFDITHLIVALILKQFSNYSHY